MRSHSNLSLILLCAFIALATAPSYAATPGPPANVTMIAGNGQVVEANFTTNVPLTILVTDANGIPVGSVPVSWTISCSANDFGCQPQFTGTLEQPTNQTDSNGIASTGYNQSFVPPGLSFTQSTVTATTSVGSVIFRVTATEALSTGSPALSAFLIQPGSNGTITGAAGTVLAGAVKLAVSPFNGINGGQGIQNVGVRIIDANTRTATPAAYCNAPAGIALTDATGNASCDLVLGNTPGSYRLATDVGGGQADPEFRLIITPGQSCTFSISPLSQPFAAAGGTGTVNVTTPSGCAWNATSNSTGFITVTSGATGNGNGAVGYTVGANTGVARSGTISVAGQIFTVNQSAAVVGPGPLTITSGSSLPGGIQGVNYSTTFTATGGTGVYSWSVTAGSLPPGLTLVSSNNTGVISGIPSAAGTYAFTVTVHDTGVAFQSQAFTIAVGAAGVGGGLTILTTSVANGTVGTAYSQQLLYAQTIQCGSPFAPPPMFSITSGSLPPGLSIQFLSTGYNITGTPATPGTYTFTLVLQNSCSQSAPVSLTIAINGVGAPTVLSSNPQSLTFNVAVNGTAAQQSLLISSTGASVTFTVAVNGSWLSVTPASAATPATLNVNVNSQSLTPGVYQGSISLTAPGNNFLSIPVTLNVATGTPAVGLSVVPATLPFGVPANSSSQQPLTILGGNGNVAVQFIASANTSTGAPWLSLGINGGTPATTVTGLTPATISVLVSTTGLLPGNYNGTITIQQQGVTSVPLTVLVTLVVTLNTLSVDTQSLAFTYTPGGASPAAQTINVLTNGPPIPVTVTSTTAAGGNWLFTTLSGGPVPTAITVTVNPAGLPRGTYLGAVIITPQNTAIPAIQVPVTLTIGAGAGPVLNGVVNGASFTPGPVAPGEFVTIFGTNLGPATPSLLTLTASGMVSTSLGGTQVLFDGLAAPLTYVSATQVNAIVPYEIFGRARTQFQVQYNGAISSPVDLGVAGSAPGIFVCASCQPANQAAALNQDSTPNSTTNGAAPGSIITLYGTGQGQTVPPGTTGAVIQSTLASPILPVSVRIAGLPADIAYAGSAPGLADGVMQLNVRIPAGVPRGATVSVSVTIGDATSNQAGIAIAP